MTTVNKFVLGIVGLGALYLVVQNPRGIYAAASSFKKAVGGTVTQVSTGGRRG